MTLQSHLLLLVSLFHKATISLFGFFIPALSSVKAIVHKDSEGYHQWSTYWLILHLYLFILSPILNLTLHPIFQIFAILWLSLPHYQGALVVYERIVNPWVDQYESKVDDAVDEAHKGVRRWLWSRLGGMTWILIGEGGNMVMGIVNVILALNRGNNAATLGTLSERNQTIPPPASGQLAPRQSVKEALSASSSSMEDFGTNSSEPTKDFVNDFISMLQQGLYVFAKVDDSNEVPNIFAVDEKKYCTRHVSTGGFNLSTFSYTGNENGAFLITQAPTGLNNLDINIPAPARLPLDNLMSLHSKGSRGLILECHDTSTNSAEGFTQTTRAEIILSDESDREILLGGLNACLPFITPRKKNS